MDEEDVKVNQYIVKLVAKKLKYLIDEKQNTFKFYPWQDICTFSKIKEKIHPGLPERAVRHLSNTGSARKILNFLNQAQASKQEQEITDYITKYLGLRNKQNESSKRRYPMKWGKHEETSNRANENLKMVEVRRLVDAIARQVLATGQISRNRDLQRGRHHFQNTIKDLHETNKPVQQKLPICPYSTCLYSTHQCSLRSKIKIKPSIKVINRQSKHKVSFEMNKLRILRRGAPRFFTKENTQLKPNRSTLDGKEIQTAVQKTSITFEKTQSDDFCSGLSSQAPGPDLKTHQKLECIVSDSEFYGKSDTLNDASMISEDFVSVIENPSPAIKSDLSEVEPSRCVSPGETSLSSPHLENGGSPDEILCSKTKEMEALKQPPKHQLIRSVESFEKQCEKVKAMMKFSDGSQDEACGSDDVIVDKRCESKSNVVKTSKSNNDAIVDKSEKVGSAKKVSKQADDAIIKENVLNRKDGTKGKKASMKLANRGLIKLMRLTQKSKANVDPPKKSEAVTVEAIAEKESKDVEKGNSLTKSTLKQAVILDKNPTKTAAAEKGVPTVFNLKQISGNLTKRHKKDPPVVVKTENCAITDTAVKEPVEVIKKESADVPAEESSDDETTYSPLMSISSEESDQSSEWSSIKENDNNSLDYTSHWTAEEWSDEESYSEDTSYEERFIAYKRALLEEDAGVMASCEDDNGTSPSEKESDRIAGSNGNPPDIIEQKFEDVISGWSFERFQEFINKDKHLLQVTDENGWNLLHKAAENGQYEFIQVLLERGMEVDTLTPNKSTPLHLAIMNNHLECCKLLMRQGANLNLSNGVNPDVVGIAEERLSTPLKKLLNKYQDNYNRVNELSNVFNQVDKKRKQFTRQLTPNLLQSLADLTFEEDDDDQ